MIDWKKIIAKFEGTPEQAAASAAEDARIAAHRAESDAWETKCYNENIDVVEFNRGRDEIDRKYGFRPTSELLASS